MALSSYHYISRVLSGRPFGDGRDGALVISSNTTQSLTVKSCSGTSGTTTVTLGSAGFSNSDVVVIHQTRGTGAGNWEINMVSSGGGTTSLTMAVALANTYTDSGASQAQIFKLPMYTTVTVNNGINWSGTDWDGDINGFLAFAANVSTTLTGTAKLNGVTGGFPNPVGNGGGFRGGNGLSSAECGEGTSGAVAVQSAANGNGGGGAVRGNQYAAGGGGGNGTAGSNGGSNGGTSVGGTGGTTGGNAGLTSLVFGGGGGGAAGAGGETLADGGTGAGAMMIFTRSLTVTGGINTNGGASATATGNTNASAGAGAGGSILLQVGSATLGSSLITASAGVAGTAPTTGINGGNGGVGRIAIYHSGTVTGTTSPTYNDTTDSSLIESGGSFLFNLL